MKLYNDRTLFIPFSRNQAGDFADEHGHRDTDCHHGRSWTAICADDVGKPLAAAFRRTLNLPYGHRRAGGSGQSGVCAG